MPPVLTTRIPANAAAAMVAATVVPPKPGCVVADARFQGETLTASRRAASAAHSSSERPTRSAPSKTATTAGVAPASAQATHCRRTASRAAAFGNPWVMTADSSATIGLPLSSACVTSAEIVNGATCRSYVGIFITPAGVAELVQAHGLGPCGVSRWRFESSRPQSAGPFGQWRSPAELVA